MLSLVPQAYADTITGSSSSDAIVIIVSIVTFAWYVICVIQAFLGYGTAYRKTKENGDNGVSLFGWMIVYSSLAAMIPGLGIYLWKKSKRTPAVMQQYPQAQHVQQPYQQPQQIYQQQQNQQGQRFYQ